MLPQYFQEVYQYIIQNHSASGFYSCSINSICSVQSTTNWHKCSRWASLVEDPNKKKKDDTLSSIWGDTIRQQHLITGSRNGPLISRKVSCPEFVTNCGIEQVNWLVQTSFSSFILMRLGGKRLSFLGIRVNNINSNDGYEKDRGKC